MKREKEEREQQERGREHEREGGEESASQPLLGALAANDTQTERREIGKGER